MSNNKSRQQFLAEWQLLISHFSLLIKLKPSGRLFRTALINFEF